MDAPVNSMAERIAALEEELARLRKSEKMYRLSAELSGLAVWTTDAAGGLTAMHTPFAVVAGPGEEPALGDAWLELVHPEDRERVAALWREAVRGGGRYEAEFRALRADGICRTVRSCAVPLHDDNQRIVGWSGTTENVEEERFAAQARREAEERLRESEELHRYTLELSQQMAFTASPEGVIASISPRFWDMTGLDPGTSPNEAIHPDDRPRVLELWTDAVDGGLAYDTQLRMCCVDGSARYVRVRAAPRLDDEGRVLRWYGTIEDIHQQHEADTARRDIDERYRLALQATNDAVWDHDLIADIVDWSENAAAILGCMELLAGRTPASWWKDRIHPEDRIAVLQSLEEAIGGDERRWSATYRFQRDDGGYADIFDRGFIIRNGDGRAVRAVGAMADLTERHQAEAEIRRMQAELIHVSRLSAMGTMASTLAHELNQPLTALGNFIGAAKRIADRDGASDPALNEALEAAEQGALRAAMIVRRMRELVSRGTVAVMVEHLPKLIEDAGVLAFVDEEKRGFRHRLDLDPAALWVRADRVQIQQVLINLIRNAVEAMDGMADKEIVISTRVAGDMVEIAVADNGVGLGAVNVDTLFSQFMTTKSEGMGLGLPISRTIVEAHGGQIWCEGRPEGGAVFRFTLPGAGRRREKMPRL